MSTPFRVADPVDRASEDIVSVEDPDLQPEKVKRNPGVEGWVDPNGIFFGCDDELDPGAAGSVKKEIEFVVREPVVVEKAAVVADGRSVVAEKAFERFGHGDPGKGSDPFPAKGVEGQLEGSVKRSEGHWGVLAFNHSDPGIVLLHKCLEVGIPFAAGFRKKNAGGPAEVANGFAEDPAGQEAAVSKRIATVDEEEVMAPLEGEVLHPVVENEDVDPETPDRKVARLNPVLVDDDGYPGEVAGEHVGFVPRFLGAEEDGVPVRDDFWRWGRGMGNPPPPPFPEGFLAALVTAAKNAYFAAAGLEFAGQPLNHGGFPSPADGEVADHDDNTPEGLIPKDAMAVEPKTQTDDALKEKAEGEEESAEDVSGPPPPPVVDHVREEAGRLVLPFGQTLAKFGKRHDGFGSLGVLGWTKTTFFEDDNPLPMQLHLLKSKILRATVTDAQRDYEGSLAMDVGLMRRVGLRDYERILVGNITNGNRFETYAIEAPEGSGTFSLNGAAAHLGKVGDLLVIMSFAVVDEREAENWHPRTVTLGDDNHTIIKSIEP